MQESLQIWYDVTTEHKTSLFKHYKTDLTLKWSVDFMNVFEHLVDLQLSCWLTNLEKKSVF